MKKLLTASIIALSLIGALFTSCGSTGGKSGAPASVHPRDYTFDLIDGGEVCNIVFNEYGPNYQAKIDLSNYVKKDKPQPGDTVYVKARFVSNVDLPVLFGTLVDPSPAAGYWLQLCGEDFAIIAENVTAGEPVDVEMTYTIEKAQKADFNFVLQYDTDKQEAPLIKKAAQLTFERVCESTDTRIGVPEAPHVDCRTIDLNTACAFCEMAKEHPWINGVEDKSVIENYKCRPEVTNLYGDDLPKAGDKIHIIWHAKADADISKMIFYAIDNSEVCAWWMELADIETAPYVENIKAGEVFDVDLYIPIIKDAVKQVSIIIQYDPGAANPDGPCIILREPRE